MSGHAGGIRIGSADFLVLPDKVDALVVAHDDALEAEFATQHIGEQPGIHMARDALDFLIGGHHPGGLGGGDGVPEWLDRVVEQVLDALIDRA